MLKFMKSGNFNNLSFSLVQLRVKMFYFAVFGWYIFPLASGSVEPHIFANPDTVSHNLADPTETKHCEYVYELEACYTTTPV